MERERERWGERGRERERNSGRKNGKTMGRFRSTGRERKSRERGKKSIFTSSQPSS